MTVPEPRFEAKKSRSVRLGRKIATGVAACALAAGVIGVAAGAANASKVKSGLSGTLTMNVFTFSAAVMNPVIAGFEKANPNVTVQAAVVSNDNTYVPRLQTEKLAGDEPSIDETYDVLTPTLEVDGLIGSLSADLKAGNPYPQSYWYPSFMASYIPPAGAPTGVGQVYALPNEADATVLLYNENEFQKAGVPFPKDGWTWSQMLADAAKLGIGSGASQTQYGICERPDWQAEYNPVLKAFGVTAFTESKASLDSGPAQKAWSLMISPMSQGLAVPQAQLTAKGDNGCEPFFESGEAAMSIEVRGNLPGVQQAVAGAFKYNAVTMPTIPGPGGKPVYPTGGGSVGWCLAPNATKNKLALAFLKYLFSSAGQAIGEKTGGVIPAEPSQNGPKALWRTVSGIGPANTQAFITAAATATIAPQTPGTVFNESNTDIPIAVQEATTGGQSIATAFGNLQSQMNAAYASNS
jgi:multiple sugar transport system substrate-binding protein